MAKKVAKKNVCMCGCPHGHGWGMLILGLLVLGNAYYSWMGWPYFIGALAVIKGVMKMFGPCK